MHAEELGASRQRIVQEGSQPRDERRKRGEVLGTEIARWCARRWRSAQVAIASARRRQQRAYSNRLSLTVPSTLATPPASSQRGAETITTVDLEDTLQRLSPREEPRWCVVSTVLASAAPASALDPLRATGGNGEVVEA